MYILCDTCSVLMLLRINPEMFIDAKFNCFTTHDVLREINVTPKFRQQYSWKTQFKNKLRALGNSHFENEEFVKIKKTVDIYCNIKLNEKENRFFNLSSVDKKIAACCIMLNYTIATEDKNLKTFLQQEFDIGNVSVLQIINDWIEQSLLTWDDTKQMLMSEWEKDGEAPQSLKEIKRFEKLTKYKYMGSRK